MKSEISEALIDLARMGGALDSDGLEMLVDRLLSPGKVMVYATGREALIMQGFAQSLSHLGLDVTIQGDILSEPIGSGDVFITSNYGGNGAVAQTIWSMARKAGAEIIVFSQDREGKAARSADRAVILPGAGPVGEMTGSQSKFSLYLLSLHLVTEVLVTRLGRDMGKTLADQRARHPNIE